MDYEKAESTTAASVLTPSTRDMEHTIIDGGQWNGLSYAVPWPGSLFIIVEKAKGKAIAVRGGKLCMEDHDHDAASTAATASSDKGKLWYCIEKNGHFGFQNQATGRYMGHNGKYGMTASVAHLRGDEFVVVRKHPQGGYQLLALHNQGYELRVISVGEDGKGLVTREHGPTLWEFYKV